LLKQNYDASNVTAGASGNLIPLFSLDAGPNSIPLVDPATAFPAVPADGFIPLTSQLSGTHIRPTRQVLPTVDAWNATVQRQITNTMSLEVSYVGSKGTHGFAGNGPNYDINPVAAGPGTSVIVADTANPGKNKFGGFSATTPSNARRPLFPRIPFDLGNYYGNDAASTYNAFEVKLDKRFSRGLQFLTHYTFSHANNYTDQYYAISHPIAWGPVDFNRNQVWVLNTVYELPFGKGKSYFSGVGRAKDLVIGGWQVSNTTNWSSGLPWTPSISECGAFFDGSGPCRPNKAKGSMKFGVGPLDPVNHTRTFFTPVPLIVDPNAFPVGTDVCSLAGTSSGPYALPACGTIGNIGKNVYHGPRGFYSDLSVSKAFSITERVRARFIMDAFNVFNHPVLAFSANNGANGCVDCQGGNNGKITGLEGGTSMRQLQFALRIEF
jgi:hypothetical protein